MTSGLSSAVLDMKVCIHYFYLFSLRAANYQFLVHATHKEATGTSGDEKERYRGEEAAVVDLVKGRH